MPFNKWSTPESGAPTARMRRGFLISIVGGVGEMARLRSFGGEGLAFHCGVREPFCNCTFELILDYAKICKDLKMRHNQCMHASHFDW